MKNILNMLVLSVLVSSLFCSCEVVSDGGYTQAGHGYSGQQQLRHRMNDYGRIAYDERDLQLWGKVDSYRQRNETEHQGRLAVRVRATNHKLTQADALLTRDRIGKWAADIHHRFGQWPTQKDAEKHFAKTGFVITEYVVPVDTIGEKKPVGSPEHIGMHEIQQEEVPQWIREKYRQEQYDLERAPGDFKDHLHKPIPAPNQQRIPLEDFDPDI